MLKNEAPEPKNKFKSEKPSGEARSKKEILLWVELYRSLFLFIRRFKNHFPLSLIFWVSGHSFRNNSHQLSPGHNKGAGGNWDRGRRRYSTYVLWSKKSLTQKTHQTIPFRFHSFVHSIFWQSAFPYLVVNHNLITWSIDRYKWEESAFTRQIFLE